MKNQELVFLEAEEYRRSHCDRKEMSHKCIGKVTLAPGVMSLDCELCGGATELLEKSTEISDYARVIARIFGVDYGGLSDDKKRQLFLELLALKN